MYIPDNQEISRGPRDVPGAKLIGTFSKARRNLLVVRDIQPNTEAVSLVGS